VHRSQLCHPDVSVVETSGEEPHLGFRKNASEHLRLPTIGFGR
jgi:hypothetical protein